MNNKIGLINLSVIMPCYQEAANLEQLIPRITKTLQSEKILFEIIVVDTEKPLDKTPLICKTLGAVYVNRVNGNSYGNAIRTGIMTANGECLLFMDADGSHSPEFILNLLNFKDSYDVVIASRYVKLGGTQNSIALEFMSRVLNWTYSKVLNLPCKDVSNSFRAYRASQLKSIQLSCENFDIVEEILVKLIKHYPKIQIKEVPFVFEMRKHGKTKRNLLLFIATYIFTLIRLRKLKK